ncbi:hypothetical protein WDZ17_15925 [Pseudokineococcus basanitobsidens]|uniref:Uncharacterized protein n=1 Tax=Pseudokineococcus basanitobsidens TaxID=1926649 RepID=A0ABU8RP87_9ACTN
MSRAAGSAHDGDLVDPAADPRRAGAHRARPGALRRLAPVLVVLVLAVLAVLVVTVWFSAAG